MIIGYVSLLKVSQPQQIKYICLHAKFQVNSGPILDAILSVNNGRVFNVNE